MRGDEPFDAIQTGSDFCRPEAVSVLARPEPELVISR